MSPSTIYSINQKRCNSCFKCVRECPFDAISFLNDKASIDNSRCIDCGICFSVCPVDAIDYINGVPKIKQLIKKQDLTVASLAPNWTSEFRGVKEGQMVEALKLLGIKHVSPTAMGAAASVTAMAKAARQKEGISISTTCPVVTSTITNFYPHLTHLLARIEPPHVAHAKMLRQIFGSDAKIVYISSCPAVFCNEGEDIDITITFKELDIWLKEENVDFDKIPGNVEGYRFEPADAAQKPDYIIPGRTIGDLTIAKPINVECSGMDDVKKILNQLDDSLMRRSMFLDMFACRGGCVNGLFSINPNRTIDSKHYFLKNVDSQHVPEKTSVEINLKKTWHAKRKTVLAKQEKIDDLVNLLKIDNLSPNCGACGYSRCVDFAKGVLTHMTDLENCILHKKRTVASDREILIKNLHCGMAFINKSNRIFLYNDRFAKIMKIDKMSREAIMSQDIYEHLLSKELKDLSEKEVEIKIYNKFYYVSKIALSNSNCFIVRNIIDENTSGAEIEQRTKTILKENMETMQKIAYLLGENASRVEGVLHSFIDDK